MFQHLRKVTPLITKLINNASEDHYFLQSVLADVAKADPFVSRLLCLHQQVHGDIDHRLKPARKPLLLMRTDFMDDRQLGAKVQDCSTPWRAVTHLQYRVVLSGQRQLNY